MRVTVPAAVGPGQVEVELGAVAAEVALALDDLLQVRDKPRIDGRQPADLLDRHPSAEGGTEVEQPVWVGDSQALDDLLHRQRREVPPATVGAQPEPADLEGAQTLLEGFLEGPADGHGLAHGLHLRGECPVGAGELLECPPRDLHDAVVDGRLEGSRGLAGDVVPDLVERVADSQLRGDLGDGEPGGLRGQGGASTHARVHLDDDHAARAGMHGELDVAPAGLDPDLADDPERGVAHPLVLLVSQRLRRCHRDAVSGVDAHGVEVLDGADDDDVVGTIPHDLELVLLPADDRLLDEHLVERRELQALGHNLAQLGLVQRNAGARATESGRRADDEREPKVLRDLQRAAHVVGEPAARDLEPGGFHGIFEELAVLSLLDGLPLRADHLDVVARQHAALGQLHRHVQARLPAQRGEQRVGPLLRDDALHRPGRDGLDVGELRQFGVGHDRGRVAVDEDDLIALLAQRLAGLGARVVELASLADDDRPRSDQ